MKISSGSVDVQESESSLLAKRYYNESKAAMSTLLAITDEIVNKDSHDISDNYLTKILSHFVALKQSQRRLGVLVGFDLQEQLSNSKRQVEESSLNFQNLLYEKNHLENEIESMKQFDSPFLLKMAKQEVHDDIAGIDEELTEESNPDDIIDHFLKPLRATDSYSHRDLSYHNSNLSKIYNETTGRGQLQNEFNSKMKEMEEVKRSYDEKIRFLQDIPTEVQKLEQACLFVQNHMKSFYNRELLNGDSDFRILPQTQIDRGDVLEKALHLPKYLYALFIQFLAFLDATSNASDSMPYHGWKVAVVDAQSESGFNIGEPEAEARLEKMLRKSNKSLKLSIPLPDVQSSRTDTNVVTFNIYFDYFTELNIVSTRCETIGATIESVFWSGPDILVNLFQDSDVGRDLPLGVTPQYIFQTSQNELREASDDDTVIDAEFNSNENPEISLSSDELAIFMIRESLQLGRSSSRVFDWCQHLCGLQYPKSKCQFGTNEQVLKTAHMNTTTRAFFQQLQRRIRCHSKLMEFSKLLTTYPLKLSDLPCHPSMKLSPMEIASQISGFKLIENSKCFLDSTTAKYYTVSLERESSRIEAVVKIEYSYPAIPPSFSLQESTTRVIFEGNSKRQKIALEHFAQVPEEPLYDASLGRIESILNSLGDSGLFFNKEVDESYDMILMHQLHFFIREWDQHQIQSSH